MAESFRTVVVESPYAGDIDRNARYLRACMADCLRRGEAPFASHGLYTQPGVLRDDVPEERARGIAAGFAIGAKMDARVFYADLGFSSGMMAGMREAERLGQPVEERRLGGEWAGPVVDLSLTILPHLSLVTFPRCDGWDHDALEAAAMAIAMARPQGWRPVAHNTGDGIVFHWERMDHRGEPTGDLSESLEPLLPVDWWPSTGDTFSTAGLERLGFVWV